MSQRARNRIWGGYNWLCILVFIMLATTCIAGSISGAMISTALLLGLLSRWFLIKRKLKPDVFYEHPLDH